MDSQNKPITIFGEVLFDCFSQGSHLERNQEQVLGGAPFNICWHLQALGDSPVFISKVGKDRLGEQILRQAQNWGIGVNNIQVDRKHPTGQVQVTLIDQEPHYDIKAECAYDFIEQTELQLDHLKGILYHGSLALRSDYAKQQFQQLCESGQWEIFLDVNLRAPWWNKESLFEWVQQAKWVKLNIDELRELGFDHPDLHLAMKTFKEYFGCEQVIVTQGAEGVTVLSSNGFVRQTPENIADFVDTVGAGDAFTAIYIHGLVRDWSLEKTISIAQKFASKVIGIRGAIPNDQSFYQSVDN